MLDYAHSIVISRARSLAIEKLLQGNHFVQAAELVREQISDDLDLWLHLAGRVK